MLKHILNNRENTHIIKENLCKNPNQPFRAGGGSNSSLIVDYKIKC